MNRLAKILTLLFVASVLVVSGCGGRCQVTGKVTFSDGTPLTFGTVTFSNSSTVCKGEIQEDGSYRMRTFKPGDGVPPGTYKIYITDTLQFGESNKTGATKSTDGSTVEFQMIGKSTSIIPTVYSNPDLSPLGEITVKGKMTKDLVIESTPPADSAN